MDGQTLEVWKILMVDDDEEDFIITRTMLSQAQGRKIKVTWAANFLEGQTRMQTGDYDAVLVDYDLGAHTGIELIRWGVAQSCPAPLILYTGRGSYAVDLEAMQAGATLYLTKGETSPLLFERSIRYAIERKRIEQERWDILESIQGGFVALARDWCITYVNRQAAETGGYQPEELVGRNLWKVAPAMVNSELEQNLRLVMQTRQPVTFEIENRSNNSNNLGVWYLVSVTPSSQGITAHWHDITEQKKAQLALTESEKRWRELAESMPNLVWTCNAAGECDYLSPKWAEFTGLPESAMLGYGWLNQVHPDDRDRVMAVWRQAQAEGSDYATEFRIRRKDGAYAWFQVQARRIVDVQGRTLKWYGSNTDIQHHIETEMVLRDREAVLAQAGQMAHLGAWAIEFIDPVNINANPLLWSDEVFRIFGYEPGAVEVSSDLFFAHVHPDDRQRVSEAVAQAIAVGNVYQIEHRITRADGVERVVLEHAEINYDDRGQPLQIIGAVQDITEQRRAEKALKAYEGGGSGVQPTVNSGQ